MISIYMYMESEIKEMVKFSICITYVTMELSTKLLGKIGVNTTA